MVIGPYNPVFELVSSGEKIPYITTTTPPDEHHTHAVSSLYTFHLLPEERLIFAAVRDIVTRYEWRRVAVIYNEGLGALIGSSRCFVYYVIKWYTAHEPRI